MVYNFMTMNMMNYSLFWIALVQCRMIIIRLICMRIQSQLCIYMKEGWFFIVVLWFKTIKGKRALQNAPLQKYYSPSIKQYMKHIMMIIPGYVNQETDKLVVKLPHHENNDPVIAWVGHSLSQLKLWGKTKQICRAGSFL